jgi:dTDP-4-amino-4,6-dideoxygalactose transaminase
VSDDAVPFHRPSITRAEMDAVEGVLESGWLTTGSQVHAFEEAFAAFVGSRHAVALNSATAALHLALVGRGVGEGDEVIVPTYTFASCGEVVLYCGARPVLVDVEPQRLTIDPDRAAAAMSERTRVLMPVHFAGLAADMAALGDLASSRGFDIVEDAAHAFPARVAVAGGRFAGTFGIAGAYSFYATKTITTGEGGMLVTGDDALATRVRQLSLHGISRDAWKRYAADGSWYYEIERLGFKDNMTDLAAALGLAQLARAQEMRNARERLARRYLDSLAALVDQLEPPEPGVAGEHAWHLFVVRLRSDAPLGDADADDQLRARRGVVIERLREAGIGTSVHFIPLHRHPLYREMGWRPAQFPVAERAYAGAISLPIFPDMTDAQVDRVALALTAALR